MQKQKLMFRVGVVVAILSTLGMVYFHFYRYDCTPPHIPQQKVDEYGRTLRLYSTESWRDWDGNCFLNVTREVQSEEYPGVWITEPTRRLKWTNGEWLPADYEPFDPYKKKP
jgi:hypothetical protein